MLIWQVHDGDFHSINHNHNFTVLGVEINITVGAREKTLVAGKTSLEILKS